MYKYLNIRYDSSYTHFLRTDSIINFINDFEEVKQTDKVQFESNTDYPWGVISLIHCDEKGLYSIEQGEYFEKVNLIEIICSDNIESFEHYLKVASRIAKRINWELVDDDNDEVLVENNKSAA